jgi:DNA-binding transcriptional LysR family regulator
MNWDDVRIFLALDRGGSFKAASRALGVHPSTVSRRLEAFEADTGVALFDRTPEGLLPTAAADRIRAGALEAEQALLGVAQELRGFDQAPAGEVRVALLETLATHMVAPHVPAFRAAHPGVQLVLVPGSRVVDLARREADIALRLARPSAGDLIFKAAGRTQLVVVGHRDHVPKGPVDPGDLDWCGWADEVVGSPDVMWVRAHAPAARHVFQSTHMDVTLRAVAAGAGVGLLPRELLDAYPGLVEVPVTAPLPPPMPLWLVTHRALRRVPRVAAAWDFLEGLLAQTLSASPTGM